MKSYPFVLCLSLLFIGFIILTSEGCKESDNDNVPASYRLTGQLFYDGDVLNDSTIYKYEHNRLSESASYSDHFGNPVTDYYNYPDENSAVLTTSNRQRIEYSYVNGQMTEMQISDSIGNVWEQLHRNTYQYQDGNLVEEIWYNGSYKGLNPGTKFTYEYEEGKIMRSKMFAYYSGWQEYSREEVVYTGDQITKIIEYSYSDSSYSEFKYTDLQYNGSLLTGYSIHFTNENEPGFSYLFSYDDHGNVIALELPEQNVRFEYVYEEGKGNFRQFHPPGGGIGGGFVPPAPIK